MDVVVSPCPLSGCIDAMPSKSHAHRAFICAAFADRPTTITLSHSSEDMQVTMDVLRALGAKIDHSEGICTIEPVKRVPDGIVPLNCGESGSTLRFILPIVAALGASVHIDGQGRLPERPIKPLLDRLQEGGCRISADALPLDVSGTFQSLEVALPGNISSQYISGFLLSAPLLSSGLRIRLTTPLESASYVDITIQTMADFGVTVQRMHDGFWVAANGRYVAPTHPYAIDGDWSNAAFFLAAGALGHKVGVKGLNRFSPQGDRAVLEILKAFGAIVAETDDAVIVESAPLRGMSIDVSDIPDLVPILAMVAAAAEGPTYFTHAGRLRSKESDRLTGTAAILKNLGGQAEIDGDTLIVYGSALYGGNVKSCNDHRLAMSATIIAATLASDPVTIQEADAVNKSYPHFFQDFSSLGGLCHELPLR